MSDPSNPNDWQQVPGTPSDPAAYPPPSQGYPPPPPGSYPPPPVGYPPPQAGYPPTPAPAPSTPMSPTAVAAISYITFIPALIFLLIEPYKQIPFVRFHAIQSIALNVVGFAIGIIFLIIAVALNIIGINLIVHLIHLCIDLALFIAWLMCIIQASQGKWFKLPILGDIALKQSGQSTSL
jgi:uncharacterized membrane protein